MIILITLTIRFTSIEDMKILRALHINTFFIFLLTRTLFTRVNHNNTIRSETDTSAKYHHGLDLRLIHAKIKAENKPLPTTTLESVSQCHVQRRMQTEVLKKRKDLSIQIYFLITCIPKNTEVVGFSVNVK